MKRQLKNPERYNTRPKKDGTPKAKESDQEIYSAEDLQGYGPEEEAEEEELFRQQLEAAKGNLDEVNPDNVLDEHAVFQRMHSIAKQRASDVDPDKYPLNAADDIALPFDFLDEIYIRDRQGRKVYLTHRQKLAICELMGGKNPRQAMKAAGYSESTSLHHGASFFRNPLVAHAVKLAWRYRMQQIGLSAEMVLDELTSLAFSDISEVLDVDNGRVRIKDMARMSRRARRSIAEITETRNNQGTTLKVRMHDKVGSLAQLARSLGMNKDKVEVDVNEKAANVIIAARERVLEARRRGESVEEAEFTEMPSDVESKP